MQSNKISFQEIFHKLQQNRLKLSKYPPFSIYPAGLQQLFANSSEIPFNVFIEKFINDGDVKNECFDEDGAKLLDALAQNRTITFSDVKKTFQEFFDEILSELSKEENQDKCKNIRSVCKTIVDIFLDPLEELKDYYAQVSKLLINNNPCINLANELKDIIKTTEGITERADRQSVIELHNIFAYTYQNEYIGDIAGQLKTTVEVLKRYSTNSMVDHLVKSFFESLKKEGLYQDNTLNNLGSPNSVRKQLIKLREKYEAENITKSQHHNDIRLALQALIQSDSERLVNKIFEHDTVETLKELLEQLKSQKLCDDTKNRLKTTAETLKKHSRHSMVGHLVNSFFEALKKEGLYHTSNQDNMKTLPNNLSEAFPSPAERQKLFQENTQGAVEPCNIIDYLLQCIQSLCCRKKAKSWSAKIASQEEGNHNTRFDRGMSRF